MEVILSQTNWDYIQQNVMASGVASNEIGVSHVLPSESDPRKTTGRLHISLSEEVAKQIID